LVGRQAGPIDERRITKRSPSVTGCAGAGLGNTDLVAGANASIVGVAVQRLDYVSNYPKAVKKSTTLFGYRELESDTVVLVESPLDVLRLAAVGCGGGGCLQGAYVSNAQVTLLVEYAACNLGLDNDKAGVEQTQKLSRNCVGASDH